MNSIIEIYDLCAAVTQIMQVVIKTIHQSQLFGSFSLSFNIFYFFFLTFTYIMQGHLFTIKRAMRINSTEITYTCT